MQEYDKVLKDLNKGLQKLNKMMLPTLDELEPEQLIDLMHENKRIKLELNIMKDMISEAIFYVCDDDDDDEDMIVKRMED
tara:strand:+ start:628 stop:867 length:240 start_codon:yes stop_codon:yes gene_type:complete